MNPATGSSTASPIASGPTAASAPARPERQSTLRSSVRNASRTRSEAADIERHLAQLGAEPGGGGAYRAAAALRRPPLPPLPSKETLASPAGEVTPTP